MGDQIVDHLSKGEMPQVEALWPEGVEWPGKTSKVMNNWIEQPRVMIALGRRLWRELSEELIVQVGRDYRGI